MLYLLNKDVRTVRWNGEPLHEATSAIVKEIMNGDFTLTVKYPISDSGIYQLIQEDMLIKAPTPVLGAQLFRIKKPVENNDHLEITAYHISDDVMQRSITPVSVTSQSCGMALSRMVQNTKTALGDFSFNSDIQDRRTFNTTETETLYSVLLDGKHSIVGTWEGELVRDNFAMTVKKSRGENRGVVITTHKNLKDYQRTRNSQNVVTRIHAKSTFKPEGAEKETTIRVTVDSPLINSYPYINEKEYENNNAKTVEELQKWAQAKFSNEGIDKVSDAIKIEAYELDGQVVHMGDTVNLKSWKHNVDALKKAIAYEFDALKEEYISLTFDDKAGVGGSRASGGLSSAADAILGVTESAQEIALEKALQNADLDFDHKAGLLRQEISDGIELARARAEEVKRELSDTIDQRFNSFDNGPLQEVKRRAEEALRNAGASALLAQEAKRIGLDSVAKLEAFKSQATSAQTALSGDLDALKRTVANDIRPKQAQVETEIAKQVEALIQTKKELSGVKSAQATYEETTTRRLAELTSLADGKVSKSELAQTADELASKIASVQIAHKNQGDRVSVVESNFRQRADALDAGVSRLTEGLRTKADISALNVTAENIRQSVKSLETDTQNKLNQKLNLAEFEVRASGIRQEIINATKDKADKTLVTAEAGKLREELASLSVGGINLLKRTKAFDRVNGRSQLLSETYNNCVVRYFKNADANSAYQDIVEYSDALYPELGGTYTLSFWAKGIGEMITFFYGRKGYLSVSSGTTSQGFVSKAGDGNCRFTLSADWQRYYVVYKLADAPADATSVYKHVLFRHNIRSTTDEIWLAGVKLERGNLATDYSENPEDTKGLITEAKATFERTAQGLRTDLSAIQEYVNKDGQRQEALQRYTREESAKQAMAVRELVARDFVGKASYQEDVRAIERKFEGITNPQNGSIATQIAKYKIAVDGRLTEITSMISGKANQTDFQRVKETSQLYERILGNTNNSISDNVARMAMTNQLFQVEVAKNASNGQNLLKGTKSFSGDWKNMAAGWKKHSDKYQGCDVLFKNNSWNGIGQEIDANIGEIYTFSLWMKSDWKNDTVNFYVNRNGSVEKGWGVPSETSVAITHEWKRYSFTFNITKNGFIFPRVERLNQNTNLYVAGLKLEKGSYATPYTEAPEDTAEAVRSVQSQLDGSWAVQNLTSAGSIVSQINATNNQILIEAEKIRLKGKTLLDELTAIQGYFKRLFVGDASVGTLNSDIIRSNSITADKLVMDIAMARRFVSSDIFTDTLAAKEAFINKLRSVVVTATLLEGYKGRIGGFQIGTHEKDSSVYWITGQNQFSVGMSNGTGQWSQTALWVNWGNNWGYPGDYAWYVKNNGKMYCYNTAEFWNTPVIHGNLRVTGHIYYNNENSGKSGHWIHSSKYSNFEPSNNYLYLYYSGSGYDWIPMNKEISDRRYKHNIEDSTVSGIDVIQKLKTYSYRKEYDGKIEDIACGIMAQDVQKYAPEAFFENPDGAYSYNTFVLVPYLIKAIQELNQKIEKMEKSA